MASRALLLSTLSLPGVAQVFSLQPGRFKFRWLRAPKKGPRWKDSGGGTSAKWQIFPSRSRDTSDQP